MTRFDRRLDSGNEGENHELSTLFDDSQVGMLHSEDHVPDDKECSQLFSFSQASLRTHDLDLVRPVKNRFSRSRIVLFYKVRFVVLVESKVPIALVLYLV